MPATSTGAGSALPTARLHTGFLIRHNSSRHILREAGQIDEGPEDEHLGTGAFPLTWSTGTGGSDRGWYRPARDLWHLLASQRWFNLRRMRRQPSSERLSMRTDPALDLRRVLLYAAALVAIYTVGVVVIIATHTQSHPQLGVLIIMFAPVIGANMMMRTPSCGSLWVWVAMMTTIPTM